MFSKTNKGLEFSRECCHPYVYDLMVNGCKILIMYVETNAGGHYKLFVILWLYELLLWLKLLLKELEIIEMGLGCLELELKIRSKLLPSQKKGLPYG